MTFRACCGRRTAWPQQHRRPNCPVQHPGLPCHPAARSTHALRSDQKAACRQQSGTAPRRALTCFQISSGPAVGLSETNSLAAKRPHARGGGREAPTTRQGQCARLRARRWKPARHRPLPEVDKSLTENAKPLALRHFQKLSTVDRPIRHSRPGSARISPSSRSGSGAAGTARPSPPRCCPCGGAWCCRSTSFRKLSTYSFSGLPSVVVAWA
jgi:hypothetical protein